jgi:hypothetical protein
MNRRRLKEERIARATLPRSRKKWPSPKNPNLFAKRLHEVKTVDNPQIDRDRPDLQRLENIVKHHKIIGTAALIPYKGATV